MPEAIESRLAALVQRVTDMAGELHELRSDVRSDHHRLRSVETAVSQMIEAQKAARRGEAAQYRRLEVKLQYLALSIAVAGIVAPIVFTLALTR